MRYYDLSIKDKQKKVVQFAAMGGMTPNTSLTSHIKGPNGERYLPQAAHIEFDITRAPGAVGATTVESWIRIFGITLQEVSQITQWDDYVIQLQGGFKKGLPLVKPEQAGIIATGKILQPFGNWILNELTLEFLINFAGREDGEESANMTLEWKANTSLKEALTKTLETAYKNVTLDIQIADADLRFDHDETHAANNYDELAQKVRTLTNHVKFAGIKTVNNSPYNGVFMDKPVSGIIRIYDNTQPGGPKGKKGTQANPTEIEFAELIGQPTWLDVYQISFSCPLRYDIDPFDYIKLPARLRLPFVISRPTGAYPNFPSREQSTFTGQFQVMSVRHVGSFRQPTAAAWATTITAMSVNWKSKEKVPTKLAEAKELPVWPGT